MDSNICVNQVYTDTRSDKQFRMLWVSPQKENSYIYWLNQKSGMPREVPLQQILNIGLKKPLSRSFRATLTEK